MMLNAHSTKVLFRSISIAILCIVSCNFGLVVYGQQTPSENNQIDVLESAICEEPRRCVNHYQCLEDGTFNIRGERIFNPRFASVDSNMLTAGNDNYEVPPNNTITLRNGGEAKICHYLERCCGKNTIPLPPVKQKLPEKGCGYRNPDGAFFKTKTENNFQAQYGEFPWVVAIIRKHPSENATKLIGGGSLIHPKVVLTAGHVISNKPVSEFIVRAGEWDTQTENEDLPYQERSVKQIIAHDEFYQPALLYDAALLIVDEPFELSATIQPICLPTHNLIFDDVLACYSAGWGKDKFSCDGRRQSIMKKVRLPIVPFNKCQDQLRRTRLGDFFELHESFVCAGGVAGQDTCTGDGGAPLVCPVEFEENRYYQTGIVAWGIECGGLNVPGVYANVALMRTWIDNQMIQNGFGTDTYTIK